MSRSDELPHLGRRDFLRAAAGLGATALVGGGSDTANAATSAAPRVQRYAKLGKTGLEISDIGFGSGGCRTADLVRYCYDQGINYFDTADMYRSEGFNRGDGGGSPARLLRWIASAFLSCRGSPRGPRPRKVSLRLDHPFLQLLLTGNTPPSRATGESEIRLVDESTDHMSFEIDLAEAAILVITDSYARGWRARALPGSVQRHYQLLPANYVLRAVPLAAGRHRLVVEYAPLAFRAGAWTSVLSTLIFLAAFAHWVRRRR